MLWAIVITLPVHGIVVLSATFAGMAFDPPGSGWVTNQGYAWHILLPGVSSQPLDGLGTGDCASCPKSCAP